MLLCSGRHSRTPQTGQLKQQKCIFSKSWGPEVLDQGVVSPKSLPPWPADDHLLPGSSRMVFPHARTSLRSLFPSRFPLLDTSQTGSEPTLTASLQRNHLMKGSASKRSSHPEFLVIRAPMYAFRKTQVSPEEPVLFKNVKVVTDKREAEDQKLEGAPRAAWQGSTMCAPGPDPRPERLVFFVIKDVSVTTGKI